MAATSSPRSAAAASAVAADQASPAAAGSGAATPGQSGSGGATLAASSAVAARRSSAVGPSWFAPARPIRPPRFTTSCSSSWRSQQFWWMRDRANLVRALSSAETKTCASSHRPRTLARSFSHVSSSASVASRSLGSAPPPRPSPSSGEGAPVLATDRHLAEAGRRGPMADAHELAGLALEAAVDAEQPPRGRVRHGVAAAPEVGGPALVDAAPIEPAQPAAPDLARHLGGELELQAAVVHAPAARRLQPEAAVGVRQQVLERAVAGREAHVRHPHERHAVPALRPAAGRAGPADRGRRVAAGQVVDVDAGPDQLDRPRRRAVVVEEEGADAPAQRGV